MQLQFKLSFDDYLAAQRLHERRSLGSRFIYMLNYYLSPLIGLFFLACGLLLIESNASFSSIAAIFSACIILLCLPLYMHMRLKRCYKRTRSDSGECKLTFDEERIGVEGQYSRGEMDWRAVKLFREDEKIFVLYTAPAKFIPVPKRICSAAQINELRTILQLKVQSGTHL
jgi:hypothetical protein